MDKKVSEANIMMYNRLYNKGISIADKYIRLEDKKKEKVGLWGSYQLNKSIKYLKESIFIVKNSWPAMWCIGKCYQVLGDHREPLKYFEKAIEYQKENPDVFREAFIESSILGDNIKSEMYAKMALELSPYDSTLIANMAMSYLLSGKIELAKDTIEKALYIRGDDRINQNIRRLIQDVEEGKRPIPKTLPFV